MTRRARAVSRRVLALVFLVTTGCGTGDVEPGTSSPTPTETPTGTPTVTPSPSATPTPANPVRVSLVSTSGDPAHEGRAALFRLIPATGTPLCNWVRIDDGDPWGFVITSAGLAESGGTYGVEVVLSADDGMTYDAGVDHAITRAAITVTTDLTLTLAHGNLAAGGWTDGGSEIATPPGFTWTNGSGCPGDS